MDGLDRDAVVPRPVAGSRLEGFERLPQRAALAGLELPAERIDELEEEMRSRDRERFALQQQGDPSSGRDKLVTRPVPRPEVVVRSARTPDVRAVRALTAPLADERVLVAKEAVAYYEGLQEMVVAEVDGQVVGTATATAGGAFTLEPTTALGEGLRAASAVATDAAGNVSPVSATVRFTVDTGTPDAPVLTNPADQSSVGTRTPTYTGTAEPRSTVTVYEGTIVVGTGQATAGGTFSIVRVPPCMSASETSPAFGASVNELSAPSSPK